MRRYTAYLPALLTAAVILYLSLIRETHISLPRISGIDLAAHAGMYALLALLWMGARLKNNGSVRSGAIWVILLCSAYGGIIEILQEAFFFPRTGTMPDFAADTIGAIAGTFTALFIWKRRKQ